MEFVGQIEVESGGFVEIGIFNGEVVLTLNFGETVFLNVVQARQLAGLLQQSACEVAK